jgi:general secretion pathway protein L
MMGDRFAVLRSLPALAMASFAAAFDWWCAELKAMVPGALRSRLGLIRPALRAGLNDGTLLLEAGLAGRSQQVYCGPAESVSVAKALVFWRQRLDTGRMDVEIMLDAGDVLVRRIELPLAAQHRLAEALNFELSRHTPFGPGDVYMTWQAGAPQSDRLPVVLSVVARDHVAALTERLRVFGLVPAAACLGETRFRMAGRSGLRWPALISATLAAVIAVLVFLLADIEVGRQEDLLARVNAELVRERRNAVEVERWKTELAQAERRQHFFGEKLGDKRVAVALDRLSRDLPNDVWLQQMTLQNGEIRLYGYAPEPATVINLLEASGQFENAKFRSPSTRRAGSAVDRFDISAQIRKGGGS